LQNHELGSGGHRDQRMGSNVQMLKEIGVQHERDAINACQPDHWLPGVLIGSNGGFLNCGAGWQPAADWKSAY
jgi:hypothetical protein